MKNTKATNLISALTILVFIHLFNAGNCYGQWQIYNMPYNGLAYTIEFYSLSSGISCGHSIMPFNGYIFYTTNSGTNWLSATYPWEIRSIVDIQYINASTVYACGADNLFISAQNKPGSDFASFPNHIRDRYLRMGKREFSSDYKAMFLKSTNGGVSWQKTGQFDTTKGYMVDIHFFNANTGYALIDSGSYGKTKFYKTTNAGQNWQLIKYIEANAIIEEMIFFDINTGFARGLNFDSGARIYKTTNGGLNWSIKPMPVEIEGFTFFDSDKGIAAGITEGATRCNVYRTNNSGENWDSIASFQGGRYMTNLKCIPSTDIAFGIGNTISPLKIFTFKSSNYGENWTVKDFNPAKMVYGLELINQNTFFISGGDWGAGAVILKSTNGGNVFVNTISAEIPDKYLLEQNYPNPFNPSTNIKFRVADAGMVKITVFNLLGKETAVIVNEQFQPGTYQAQFDGGKLASGIYIYKMEAGGYTQTRKMILLK